MYAYGQGEIAGKQALLLFTEGEEGGKVTMRIREESDPVDRGGEIPRLPGSPPSRGKYVESSGGAT
jgi:hypothetical protein